MNLGANTPTQGLEILQVEGDLDLYTAVDFQNKAYGLLQKSIPGLVVDFGGVDYLDSSGVGALIRILQKAKTLGRRVVVRGLHGSPLQVLKLCNLYEILTLEEPLGHL